MTETTVIAAAGLLAASLSTPVHAQEAVPLRVGTSASPGRPPEGAF